VHCPWCDSAGTWHKDYVPKHIEKFTFANLANEAAYANPEFVVLTGGEPTVQPRLAELIAELKDAGLKVHIETCGAFPFETDTLDWITLSPKREKLPSATNLLEADEIKLIIDHPNAVSEWLNTLYAIVGSGEWLDKKTVWLHPEWSQRENPEILNAISEAVKDLKFRAGWQLHKLYKVDALDPNSKPTVPLGGNPQLGF
jgi:organic radical activating enzyme